MSDIATWISDTSDMQLATTGSSRSANYANITGNLPTAMIDHLANLFAATPSRPLWVHLVKPYGPLRFVPWERSLGVPLSVPILMLPDFIFPPLRETASALEVALCGSAPLDHEEHWVHEAMHHVSRRILQASPRTTRLHVFADSGLTQRLRDEFNDDGRLGVDVFVHGPEDAAPFVEPDPSSELLERSGHLRSPWLRWMRQALEGRSLDVVHFVGHGILRRERGAMLFAQSPIERTDRYVAGPVGQTELVSFLTQTGAWSTAFTSVMDDNSEPGLRDLADGIAQSRPGPLLMQMMREDPSAEAIVNAYRFLYSVAPMDAPRSTSLFMYCQPHRIRDNGVEAPPRRVRSASAYFDPSDTTETHHPALGMHDESPLGDIFRGQSVVAPWVSATERFAEQVELNVEQSRRDASDTGGEDESQQRGQAALDLVEQLRASVARVASSQENDERDNTALGAL